MKLQNIKLTTGTLFMLVAVGLLGGCDEIMEMPACRDFGNVVLKVRSRPLSGARNTILEPPKLVKKDPTFLKYVMTESHR